MASWRSRRNLVWFASCFPLTFLHICRVYPRGFSIDRRHILFCGFVVVWWCDLNWLQPPSRWMRPRSFPTLPFRYWRIIRKHEARWRTNRPVVGLFGSRLSGLLQILVMALMGLGDLRRRNTRSWGKALACLCWLYPGWTCFVPLGSGDTERRWAKEVKSNSDSIAQCAFTDEINMC